MTPPVRMYDEPLRSCSLDLQLPALFILAYDTLLYLQKKSLVRFGGIRSGQSGQLLLNNSDRGVDLLDLNAKSDGGWTAFMFACNNHRKDVVQLVLDFSTDRNNFIPLGFACKKYCRMDCIDVRLSL